MPRRTPWRIVRSFAKWACTVAAVLLGGACVASYFAWFSWYSSRLLTFVDLRGGTLLVVRYDAVSGTYPEGLRAGWQLSRPLGRGVQYFASKFGGFGMGTHVATLEPVALAFALPAAFFLWRDSPAFPRPRAMRRNECPACGYSLAGLPQGNECPECGVTQPAR